MTDHHTINLDHPDAHDHEREEHRAICPRCRSLWNDLEKIATQAAQLPPLTPSRDLWSGIEARIAPARERRRTHANTIRVLMAASVLIAVTAAVTWRIATRTDADAPDIATVYLTALSGDAAPFETEITSLQEIVSARRADLDPATREVLERNLAVIDAAIAETRDALARDPHSIFLAQRITRVYTRKLTILRGAAQLPVGI
jgi:hypothetical protein